LTPHDARSIRFSELALASVRRELREGDRGKQAAGAYETFDDALRDDTFDTAERTTILGNRMSAMHQRRLLAADSVARSDVLAAVDACVTSAYSLAAGHPTRVQTLSNAGSVLGDVYHQEGFTQAALLDRALDLAGAAYTEAKAAFGAANPETLRTGLNHAALLGMPVRVGTSNVRYHDGDASACLLRDSSAAAGFTP
jgi:hypothetical protein